MHRRASEVIAEGDLGAIVDYTIGLNRKKVQIDQDLEEAKAYLREVAKRKKSGGQNIDLEGLSGVITITFPGLAYKTKKGADLEELKENLPEEVFAQLFKRSVVVVPAMPPDDFLEALGQQKPAHRATVGHFISVENQTPKVYVPR